MALDKPNKIYCPFLPSILAVALYQHPNCYNIKRGQSYKYLEAPTGTIIQSDPIHPYPINQCNDVVKHKTYQNINKAQNNRKSKIKRNQVIVLFVKKFQSLIHLNLNINLILTIGSNAKVH